MLAIFKKGLVDPPKELNSPAQLKPKHPDAILKHFLSANPSNAFSMAFGDKACLAYATPQSLYPSQQRLFGGVDDIYCIFAGTLNNLCTLNKQYGLSKFGNEAMFVIEAYRTLRDRGPYPAHEVLKGLDGSFGFVVYDAKAGTVFAAQAILLCDFCGQGGDDGGVKLFWGIAADGSVVISDNLGVIKASCAKSFAPFPTGCMYHSAGGLMSFEHPKNKMKAMPRVDSEGFVCGANFKADVYSKVNSMPRVGSEANWAIWGQEA
ncbi:hypothetical protein RJ640_030124 [Escallonia rubra]|uniref:DUF3700 domain-containing protein n=1 Tax=Escallonia rubra TaxID=112253 RepID=A0AA88QTD6_9ASTE|nr:hypothetical protein RJ640_030124 [Escallonia rubra]